MLCVNTETLIPWGQGPCFLLCGYPESPALRLSSRCYGNTNCKLLAGSEVEFALVLCVYVAVGWAETVRGTMLGKTETTGLFPAEIPPPFSPCLSLIWDLNFGQGFPYPTFASAVERWECFCIHSLIYVLVSSYCCSFFISKYVHTAYLDCTCAERDGCFSGLRDRGKVI